MVEKVGEIREPLYGYVQEILVVPLEKLRVVEIQRKPSTYHVRRLAESMRKIGFTTPVIAVRRGEDDYVVIDGQHRLLAAKQVGIKQIPVIVIPERYVHDLMELNVEKQMSLRERAYVALNVYRMYLEEEPSMPENDPKLMDSVEYAYYVTLGMAYERSERLFGSAYESLLKRTDGWLGVPMSEAVKVRERRADIVMDVDRVAREAVERVKELGIAHPFLYKEVVSFCNPIGRKRKVDLTMEEVFRRLKENLEDLVRNPEKIRMHKLLAGYEL